MWFWCYSATMMKWEILKKNHDWKHKTKQKSMCSECCMLPVQCNHNSLVQPKWTAGRSVVRGTTNTWVRMNCSTGLLFCAASVACSVDVQNELLQSQLHAGYKYDGPLKRTSKLGQSVSLCERLLIASRTIISHIIRWWNDMTLCQTVFFKKNSARFSIKMSQLYWEV